jgi:hypothetical protein
MKRKMKVLASLPLTACLILALAALCHSAYAQKGGTKRARTPTGPGEITAKNEEINLADIEGGFEVLIPGIPERRLIKGIPSVEKPDVHQYDLHNTGESYSVRYADYNFTVTDPAKLKIVYDLVKQEYFDRAKQEQGIPEAILLSEKDVFLDGKLGRELVIAWNKRVIWFRFFLIQQRIYQLFYSAATGRQSAAATIRLREKKAARFFNSFIITNPPPPLPAHANNH